MKRFMKTAALLTAVLSISFAVMGCQGDSNGSGAPGVGGIPGAPGFVGGVAPLPGGGAQVAFTGTDIYLSSLYMYGDYTNGMGSSNQINWYCSLFTGPMPAIPSYQQYFAGQYVQGLVPECWFFSAGTRQDLVNPFTGYPDTGLLQMGGGAIPIGGAGSETYVGNSQVEPGTSITIVAYPGQRIGHSNITGVLNISPYYMQRKFPQGMPAVVGLTLDFQVLPRNQSGYYEIRGGFLIHTSGNKQTGYTGGAFIRI